MSDTPGILHLYAPKLQAFEFTKQKERPKNVLVFIGGLTDSLLTTPYIKSLAESVRDGWALIQVLTSSSGDGWATGSLDRDVEEISKFVQYLKDDLKKEKVVLFGHSTGCQDAIHYALKKNKEVPVDGIVLQAPVSDRETIENSFVKYEIGDLDQWNREATEISKRDGPDTILPKKFIEVFFNTPTSAYRWLSLCTKGGDDDYFSSDLPSEVLGQTFGKLKVPTCILYSGSDECVPTSVDKEILLAKWKSITPPEHWSLHSEIVIGATHQLGKDSEPGALERVLKLANRFLKDISN